MAEPNPQPEAEAASAPPPSKGGGIMGPIIAAIIIVAGIAGIFNFMVVPALDTKSREVMKTLHNFARLILVCLFHCSKKLTLTAQTPTRCLRH